MNNINMDKVCPLRLGGKDYAARPECIGARCSWWCDFANDCSIPLLAGMFADSSVCRNTFNSYDSSDDIGIF